MILGSAIQMSRRIIPSVLLEWLAIAEPIAPDLAQLRIVNYDTWLSFHISLDGLLINWRKVS